MLSVTCGCTAVKCSFRFQFRFYAFTIPYKYIKIINDGYLRMANQRSLMRLIKKKSFVSNAVIYHTFILFYRVLEFVFLCFNFDSPMHVHFICNFSLPILLLLFIDACILINRRVYFGLPLFKFWHAFSSSTYFERYIKSTQNAPKHLDKNTTCERSYHNR